MELDTLASIENGTYNADKKDTSLISDASQFQVSFKTRGVTFDCNLFISIAGVEKFPISKLNEDLSDLIIKYVQDNMGEYTK